MLGFKSKSKQVAKSEESIPSPEKCAEALNAALRRIIPTMAPSSAKDILSGAKHYTAHLSYWNSRSQTKRDVSMSSLMGYREACKIHSDLSKKYGLDENTKPSQPSSSIHLQPNRASVQPQTPTPIDDKPKVVYVLSLESKIKAEEDAVLPVEEINQAIKQLGGGYPAYIFYFTAGDKVVARVNHMSNIAEIVTENKTEYPGYKAVILIREEGQIFKKKSLTRYLSEQEKVNSAAK